MFYIVIGIFGFLTLHLFDVVSLKRAPTGIKPSVWVVGYGLLTYSFVMLCLQSNSLPLPVWGTWFGWGLLPISLFLLTYSLFVNLPFHKTYIAVGLSDKLITTGLYALVRHPWIHCFALVLVSLILISKSNLLLIAAPIFILLDVALVIVQDKFFLVRMFDDYARYQQETPMLVPNRRSISTFIRGLRSARAR